MLKKITVLCAGLCIVSSIVFSMDVVIDIENELKTSPLAAFINNTNIRKDITSLEDINNVLKPRVSLLMEDFVQSSSLKGQLQLRGQGSILDDAVVISGDVVQAIQALSPAFAPIITATSTTTSIPTTISTTTTSTPVAKSTSTTTTTTTIKPVTVAVTSGSAATTTTTTTPFAAAESALLHFTEQEISNLIGTLNPALLKFAQAHGLNSSEMLICAKLLGEFNVTPAFLAGFMQQITGVDNKNTQTAETAAYTKLEAADKEGYQNIIFDVLKSVINDAKSKAPASPLHSAQTAVMQNQIASKNRTIIYGAVIIGVKFLVLVGTGIWAIYTQVAKITQSTGAPV